MPGRIVALEVQLEEDNIYITDVRLSEEGTFSDLKKIVKERCSRKKNISGIYIAPRKSNWDVSPKFNLDGKINLTDYIPFDISLENTTVPAKSTVLFV